MSKKKKKKKKSKPLKEKRKRQPAVQKVRSVSSMHEGPTGPPKDEKQRLYMIERIRRLLAQGREAEALALAGRLWPVSETEPSDDWKVQSDSAGRETCGAQEPDEAFLERARGLFSVWPDRAVEEILRFGPRGIDSDGLQEVLSDVLLTLDDHQFAAIESLKENDWLREARLVRSASLAISQGRDQEAMEHLKGVGLRSKLKEARVFLRGLSAYYRKSDSEAKRALEMLLDSRPYKSASRGLLYILGSLKDQPAGAQKGDPKEYSDATNAAAQKALEAFGGPSFVAYNLYRNLYDPIEKRQVNLALRMAGKVLSSHKGDYLRNSIARDVAAAILSMGIDPHNLQARLKRALPYDRSDPRGNHLSALVLEKGGCHDKAIDYWLDYSEDIRRSDTSIPQEDTTCSLGAIMRHVAQALLGRYVEGDSDFMPFSFGGNPELLEDAYEYSRRSVDLDPGDIDNWLTVIEVYEQGGDAKQTWRVLEEMLTHFPDHPSTLAACAEHAGRRSSPDKGLRFVRRAQELEPLNRSHRQMEAWLLMVKARKEIKKGKSQRALDLYHEARSLPHLDASSILKSTGEQAALLEWNGDIKGVRSLKEEIVSVIPSPWLWTGYFLVGREHVKRNLTGAPRLRMKLGDLIDVDSDVSHDELTDLLSLVSGYQKDLSKRLPGELRLLMTFACKAGVLKMREKDLIKAAIHCLEQYGDKEAILKAAEHGHRLFPQDGFFVVAKYSIAMDMNKPPEYFINAEEELSNLKKDICSGGPLEEVLDEELELSEIFEDFMGPFRLVPSDPYSCFLEDIRDYLKKYEKRMQREKKELFVPDDQFELLF